MPLSPSSLAIPTAQYTIEAQKPLNPKPSTLNPNLLVNGPERMGLSAESSEVIPSGRP